MPTVLGIDEAGRGPVIGPLVIAGTMMEEKELFELDRLGVKESKLLTPAQREHFFDKIKSITKHKIIEVSAAEVDAAVESETTNLNWLEADKTIAIINALKPDTAIIDCPSTNISAYTAYLKKGLKTKTKLVVEHKADLNYTIAGAASILAKVTRDRAIEKLQEAFTIPLGSGYPSDPLTQAFLKKHHVSHKELFRQSWASYKNAVEGKKQSKLGEY